MEVVPLPDLPLSCDRTEDELWSKLDDEPDEHERGCAHCQAQRLRLTPLSLAASQWKSADEAEDNDSLLGGIRNRVMEGIRAEIRRGTRFTLRVTSHGPLKISGYLLLETLREAVDARPGLELRNHKIIPGSAPGSLSLAISLVLHAGQDGAKLAAETREAIMAHFTERIGIALGRVDIMWEDVIHGY